MLLFYTMPYEYEEIIKQCKKHNDIEKMYENIFKLVKKDENDTILIKTKFFYYIFNKCISKAEDTKIIKDKLRDAIKKDIKKYEETISRFSMLVNDDIHYSEDERLIALLKKSQEQHDLDLLNVILIKIYYV
jgi:hypothetical protein